MSAHHIRHDFGFIRIILQYLLEIYVWRIVADIHIIGLFQVGEICNLINLPFLKAKSGEQEISREEMVFL